LHLAASVGTKTIGLHGPTNPIKWAAYTKNTITIQSDKYCSPCLYLGHDYGCEKPNCMEYIKVDGVFLKTIKALNLHLISSRLAQKSEINA
jgi:ADP-heptose:LPS heptosyltransferase